jgi:hypothetical protein
MSEAPEETPGLTERERRMLAFERSWWSHAGNREEAVRAEFGTGSADYLRTLNTLIDRPEAIAYDGPLVRRLRRQRALRRTDRRQGRMVAPD